VAASMAWNSIRVSGYVRIADNKLKNSDHFIDRMTVETARVQLIEKVNIQ
jgi:hypothetical protein